MRITNYFAKRPVWVALASALVAALMLLFVSFEGAQSVRAADDPRIIGGTELPNGKYLFMAALIDTTIQGNTLDQQFCGGSLIDRDSVLTAAHCVTNEQGEINVTPQELRVVVGRTVLNSNQGQEREVARRPFVHPLSDPQLLRYDVAVLKLNRPVSGIAPIKLATAAQNNLEKPGRKATVAGWGSTHQYACGDPPQPEFPNRLREVQVPIVSDSRAVEIYQQVQCPGLAKFVPKLMIAAGKEGKDACQADSGGPLFVARNGVSSSKYTQIGIVSFGPGCGVEPNAYTEVNNPSVRAFITNKARK
jgi:secreted trypsin-like serine protease